MAKNMTWEISAEIKGEGKDCNVVSEAINKIADEIEAVLGVVEISIMSVRSESDLIGFETTSYHDAEGIFGMIQTFTHDHENVRIIVMYCSDVDECQQKAVAENGNVTYYEAQITYAAKTVVDFNGNLKEIK